MNRQNGNRRGHNRHGVEVLRTPSPDGDSDIEILRTPSPYPRVLDVITLHDTDSEPEPEPEVVPEPEPEPEPIPVPVFQLQYVRPEPEYIVLDSDGEQPENDPVPNPPEPIRIVLPPCNESMDDDDEPDIPDPDQPGPSRAINRTPQKSPEDPRRRVTQWTDEDDESEFQNSKQPGPSLAINNLHAQRSRRQNPDSLEDPRRVDQNQPGPSSASKSGPQSRSKKPGRLEDSRRALASRNYPVDDGYEWGIQDSDQPGPSSAINLPTSSRRRKQSRPQKCGPSEDSWRDDDSESEVQASDQPGPSSAITSSTASKSVHGRQSRARKSGPLKDSENVFTPKNKPVDVDKESEVPAPDRLASLRKRRAQNRNLCVDSGPECSEGDDSSYTKGARLQPVTDSTKRRRKGRLQQTHQRNPDELVDSRITAIKRCLKENEYIESDGAIDPGVHPPLGLGHTPYRLQQKPEGFVSSAKLLTPTRNQPETRTRKRIAPEAPEAEDNLRMMTEHWKEIEIGPEFQADLSNIEMITGNADEYYGYEKEYEEVFWEPIGSDDDPVSQENMKKRMVEIKDDYWRVVWRQFEGHIPYEYALQNLWKNRYRICGGLETIDQCLLKLPEMMKPVRWKQAKRLMREGLKENLSLKKMRDSSMTNYYLDDVHKFHYQLIRFYMLQPYHGVPCVCNQSLCEPLDFEPRIGCSNCTRHFWNESSGPSTSSSRPPNTQKLCLLCQTHERLAKRPRPVKNLILTDEERSVLEQWKRKEQESGEKLTLEDVTFSLEQKTMKRWQEFDLDTEEMSILKRNEITYSMDMLEILQPFRLPLFSRCGCLNGGIPTNLPPVIEGRKPFITGQGLPWLPEKEYYRQEDPKTDKTSLKKKRRSKKGLQDE